MKKHYVFSGELHDENEHGHLCEAECCHPVYFAPEVDARIAELETRLIACETAMLLGCNINHPGIQSYFGKYPDPYIPG